MATINPVGNALSGITGTGKFAGDTSPTFVTPTLGDATATSLTAGNLELLSNTLQSNDTNGLVAIVPNGSGQILIGSATAISISGVTPKVEINSTSGGVLISRSAASASGPATNFMKSRSSTIGSHGAVQNGDILGNILYYADDGTTFNTSCAGIAVTVSGSVSTGIIPTQMVLSTMNTSGVLTSALSISNAQIVTLQNALAVTSGGTGVTASTGTGSVVLNTSPTLVTPLLGTPTSGNATNMTVTGGLRSFQVFTSGTAQTYTKPANVSSILVEVIGGGGGGGGAAGSTGTGTGGAGGGGGYARLYVASASATYTYTVGGGGAGGTAGNNAGTAGTTTTFSASSLQASGGGGGGGGANTATIAVAVGGMGGVGANGNINSYGQPGGAGITLLGSSGIQVTGPGGGTVYGGGAEWQGGSGTAGHAYGGGGGGGLAAVSNVAGGNGAAGVIIVWEFS